MRWIGVASTFVILVLLLAQGSDVQRSRASLANLSADEPHMANASDLQIERSARDENWGDEASQPVKADSPTTVADSVFLKSTTDATLRSGTERISMGEPMDPNDESTLPVRTERISIGEPMDPNDESTLPVRTERISIGEPMDVD